MQISHEKPIFSLIDKDNGNENDKQVVANLLYEYWREIDYPHKTIPAEFLKRQLQFQFNKNQITKYVLMRNSNYEDVGFISLNISIGKHNRELVKTHSFIKPEFRRKYNFKKLFLESINHIPNYVKTYSFFFRIDDDQENPSEKKSLDAKLKSLKDELEAKLAFTGRRSESDLTKFDLSKVTKTAEDLKQKAKQNGYDIYFMDDISFSNVPFTMKQYVKLIEEISNDMPRDESLQEDTDMHEKDFLNWYAFAKEDQMIFWHFIAVDTKSGFPVGMTETRIHRFRPEISYVADTGVHRDHRGKKLGLTLKYQMLVKLLSFSQVKTWITFNAKSNNHMISINDELGYKQSSLDIQYEIPIDKLKNYFESK